MLYAIVVAKKFGGFGGFGLLKMILLIFNNILLSFIVRNYAFYQLSSWLFEQLELFLILDWIYQFDCLPKGRQEMINLKHKIWSCILFLNQSPKGLDSHAVEEECQGIHIGNQKPDVFCCWQDLLLIFLIYAQKIRNLLLFSTIYKNPFFLYFPHSSSVPKDILEYLVVWKFVHFSLSQLLVAIIPLVTTQEVF